MVETEKGKSIVLVFPVKKLDGLRLPRSEIAELQKKVGRYTTPEREGSFNVYEIIEHLR